MANVSHTAEELYKLLIESCDDIEYRMHLLEKVEKVLHTLSTSILGFFFGQIIFVMIGLGKKFFRNPFFVVDFIVIGVAFILEAFVSIQGVGLVAFEMLWRCLRILHAFSSTVEVQKRTVHKKEMSRFKMKAILANDVSHAFQSHLNRGEEVVSSLHEHIQSRENLVQKLDEPGVAEFKSEYEKELNHATRIEREYVELYTTAKNIYRDLSKVNEEFHKLQLKSQLQKEV
eukprot:c5034_g1_i2.p1 GENE.c5034_g1_i2~~c5034_g1_i2.p1  ORF type:complete len:230 (-),score=76.54 c5034_g1_i2:8-697(-)